MTGKQRFAVWSAGALGAWYLFTQPKNAAGAVGGALGLVGDMFTSVTTFLTALFS